MKPILKEKVMWVVACLFIMFFMVCVIGLYISYPSKKDMGFDQLDDRVKENYKKLKEKTMQDDLDNTSK